MPTKILVTGATGNIGSLVVKELAATDVLVRALVRTPARAAAIAGADVKIVAGDFDQPTTLAAALVGIERVFLMLADTPERTKLQANFIQAAKEAKVQQIVSLSMLGAEADSAIMFARWHWQSDQQLQASGIPYTILQPNLFMQNFLRQAASVKARSTIALPMGETKVSSIDIRDIAAVAARILVAGSHINQTLILTGSVALNYAEATAKISSALGKEIVYVTTSLEDTHQNLLKAGVPAQNANDLVELYRLFDSGYGAAVTNVVPDILKRAPISFDQFARDHASVFSG